MFNSKISKTVVRISCFVLTLLVLCTGFVSCGTSEEDETNTQETTVSTTETEEINEGDYVPTAIAEDFGGYEFRVLTRKGGAWMSGDISGDISGNVVDQAVYIRNDTLKTKYNFSVKETQDAKWTQTATTLGEAGEDAYEMWSFRMNDMPSFGQQGYIYNLNDVNGLNLDAQYYDQNTRKWGSFNNYLFFLTGDMLYMDDMATNIMTFNRTMYNDLKLADVYGKDIYELAYNHEWTLETYREYCKLATADMNGDGVMTLEEDRWGTSTQNGDVINLNIAFGNRILDKNADDIFVFNPTEQVITDLQNIMELANSQYVGTDDWTKDRFTYGNQLFYTGDIHDLPTFTAKGLDYGVIPLPHRNAEQKEYYSFISTYGSNCITLCRTLTGDKLDKAANVIELLSYESQLRVTPKFTEYVLGGRLVNSYQDADMLQFAMNSKTYELCYLWSTGGLYSTLTTINSSGGIGVASALEACRSTVEASVDRKLDRLNQLT